jgi:hypothetical protein
MRLPLVNGSERAYHYCNLKAIDCQANLDENVLAFAPGLKATFGLMTRLSAEQKIDGNRDKNNVKRLKPRSDQLLLRVELNVG